MTADQLAQAAGIEPGWAAMWHPHIEEAMGTWGILEPENQAAFIAQATHESAGFTRLEENLFYTTPARLRQVFRVFRSGEIDPADYVRDPVRLANLVYAYRLGNGGPETGDGWRYRGRGLFQITGRKNYERQGHLLSLPLLAFPEFLEEHRWAAMSAAAYWTDTNCSEATDFDQTTLLINGPAMLGADERRAAYARALAALA